MTHDPSKESRQVDTTSEADKTVKKSFTVEEIEEMINHEAEKYFCYSPGEPTPVGTSLGSVTTGGNINGLGVKTFLHGLASEPNNGSENAHKREVGSLKQHAIGFTILANMDIAGIMANVELKTPDNSDDGESKQDDPDTPPHHPV